MTTTNTGAVRTADERTTKEAKRKRPLFGVRMGKLDVEYKIPGYQLAWIADQDDGRIDYALECGYNFVNPKEIRLSNTASSVTGNKDESDRISIHAGLSESGRPMKQYLMKIEQEYYDEARAENARLADKFEQDIYGSEHSPVDGGYTSKNLRTNIGQRVLQN